jgi:biopolymer transport protein ExbB
MRAKMKQVGFLLWLLLLLPQAVSAWWNSDWSYKKEINLDLKQVGVNVSDDAFALVRLHTGNFAYFMDLGDAGNDIRFMSADDKTPLKFYIEKLDLVNEIGLIWVKLPKNLITAPNPTFYMYYGNPLAADGQDPANTFGVSQILRYSFGQAGIRDMTAYENNPVEATANLVEGGVVGNAAEFSGSELIRIQGSPSTLVSPDPGWTFSIWLKIKETENDAVVLQHTGTDGGITVAVKNRSLNLEVADVSGALQLFTAKTQLIPGDWHHIALVVAGDQVALYIDGTEDDIFSMVTPAFDGDITLGADATGGRGLVGAIDQLEIFKEPRSAQAIKFDVMMQGMASPLVVYGEDMSPDSEGESSQSHVLVTLQYMSVDGWVIVGILGAMLIISFMVMAYKAIVILKNHKENSKFEAEFMKLKAAEIEALNRDETEDDQDVEVSPLLASLTGGHDRFVGSSIYKLYHVGIEELHHRLPKSVGADVVEVVISDRGIDSIRSAMESCLVRETQKLNSLMVLLTIAISGGPFLGLLGTVIGVMATFGEIAAMGEVNVNTIAPGIAAALATTVAGLVVAIPCLFGYNYLNSRIKVITADMYIFVDEFSTKLSERYS